VCVWLCVLNAVVWRQQQAKTGRGYVRFPGLRIAHRVQRTHTPR
jgi:hypothetical protein